MTHPPPTQPQPNPSTTRLTAAAFALLLTLLPTLAFAHGVDDATRRFLLENEGSAVIPFLYIGAKHMVTGYDHILFLVGVIFLLYNNRDVLLYVSLFTLGHSITLLLGVLAELQINAFIIDAIIGLSVVYKGFDNLGGFKRLLPKEPNPKAAVFTFGLFHGLGLATKLQEFNIPPDGLFINLVSFNIGVEIGQFLALGLVLIAISFWRHHPSYLRMSTLVNTLLIALGFALAGFHIAGYLLT